MSKELILNFEGLKNEEIAVLQKRYGHNILPAEKKFSAGMIFLSQFKSPLVYVILVAAAISLITKEYTDAVIISIVVLANALAGFFQEQKTQKTYLALKALLRPMTEVIRNGRRETVDMSELVPGDIVILTAGDKVPADGIILESAGLGLSEAILTGESEVIFKDVESNKRVFMGTIVATGRGTMRVERTGIVTELGKIAQTLKTIKEPPTPLQRRLKKFSLKLTYIVLTLALIIFILNFAELHSFSLSLKLAAVLAVAAIPEGLIIAVTIILVLGMQRILRRRGLVKRLLAVETLGSVTVICTDKTGTLTEGNMRVTKNDFKNTHMAMLAMALCNNLEDSLEVAFWKHVQSSDGFDHTLDHKKVFPRLGEEPFSGETKFMMTTNQVDGELLTFAKGAPEVMLAMSRLSEEEIAAEQKKVDAWADEGLKVLGLAYKQGGNLKDRKDFIWLGLVGVEDPLRFEVQEAIDLCRQAQIKIKMITGDHPKTALAIAKKLGLASKPEEVVEASLLDLWSVEELRAKMAGIKVLARIAPHQKMKIVEALQANGEVVAMIGDGVNDALAIKRADIGVATGEVSDVAKEAASLILLDSNFKTIVAAVEEGRGIYENVKKVIAYVLANSFGLLTVVFFALALGWPAPLLVAQILWINLITDGPVDIVLGFEPKEKEIMKESPQYFQKNILEQKTKWIVAVVSLIGGLFSLLYFWYFGLLGSDLILGRSLVFTNLAVASLVYIFSFRSFRHPFWKTANLFKNKFLIGAVALGFILQVAVIYMPFLNRVFEVKPLLVKHWILALIPSFLILAAIELIKFSSNRRQGRKNV